jgi:hypothetical protein
MNFTNADSTSAEMKHEWRHVFTSPYTLMSGRQKNLHGGIQVPGGGGGVRVKLDVNVWVSNTRQIF